MKIGILGSGNIGGTLGVSWALAGHEIVFGVRNPDQKRRSYASLDLPQNTEYRTVGEAIAQSEAILFAVPSRAVPEVLDDHGGRLDEKILIDATNDFGAATVSKVAEIVAAAPNARVYRAFNSLGWESFKNPLFGTLRADLFYCGTLEDETLHTIDRLIEELGLRPVWLGGLDMVEVVDAIARLWIALAVRQGRGRHLAFKVLED